MNQLLQRLMNAKQLTYKELVCVAEFLGYHYASQSGSHLKYEKEGAPYVVITASTKRSNALHQHRTEKTLRLVYKEMQETKI